jgi:hypothetical protein
MTMTPLLPDVATDHACVYCHTSLQPRGSYIPGMRNLALLTCTQCGREFYGDLRSGQAFFTPQLLEIATGKVHDPHGVAWFASWLEQSFAHRVASAPELRVIEHRPVTRPVVFLNCLDTLYGHVLLKLLNAQAYIDRSDVDLIVMLPASFAWLVPDGAAQVWLVDLPLARGTEWNDGLASEIATRLGAFAEVHLSIARSHPRAEDYDIERFTRVKPFPLAEWRMRVERPTVTFIWREDRTWNTGIRRSQQRNVASLEKTLRRRIPAIDMGVVGIGTPGGLPPSIHDLRLGSIDVCAERAWCERYAASHLVIGVHGSNMLLPSAHAGGVIELLPRQRWGNVLQDLLVRPAGTRELLFRNRLVPDGIAAEELGELAADIITGLPRFLELMGGS